jgi:UDP-N-acetylmuramoyl-tripeptide--D-alanyl-D-alanine ligase
MTKQILLWTYLWQIKEYHIQRFLVHFHTADGARLIFNKLLFIKLCLPLLFFSPHFPLVIFGLYFLEAARFFTQIFQKKIKRPVLTKKTIFILFALFFVFIYAIVPALLDNSWNVFCLWLLIIDIFAPLIISLIILAFQPLTVLLRNRIIKKATLKRKGFKDLLVIGITGSYGKTSTKEFLYAILCEKFGKDKVLKTREHQNSEIGISQCILQDLKPGHQIFICEMGAYSMGGIKLLCDIAKPKIGILTGINEQHLATFGSQENIIKTKFELIKSLPKDGTAILNADCKKIQNSKSQIPNKFKIQNSKFKIHFFSIEKKYDVWAEDIEVGKEDMKFKVCSKDKDSADFRVKLLGRQSISNVLGAVAAAKELGMKLKDSARACEKIEPMRGSGVLVKSKQGLNIIDATYSANPSSVIAHLDYLKQWKGKKIIVMPCLIELGSAFEDVHQKIGAKIAENCDFAIITKKECYDIMKNFAVQSGTPTPISNWCGGKVDKEKILFMQNPREIFDKLKNFNNPEDVILLESRVSKELIEMLEI